MSEAALLRRQHEAFEVYREAHRRMMADMTFDNAMAAKEAWWAFLHIFDEVTATPSTKIIPFPRRYPHFGGAA